MRNFINTRIIAARPLMLALGAAVTFLALAATPAGAAPQKVDSWDLYYDDGSYFGTLDMTRAEAKTWCGYQVPHELGELAPIQFIYRAGRLNGNICR